jgi:hypothetical protein
MEATTECGWKRGDTDTGYGQSSRKPFRENSGSGRERDCGKWEADGALEARMRRCLKLRQGASPLRPPAPFPSDWIIRKGGNLSRVRCAGQKQAALDRLPPFRRNCLTRGKGGISAAALVSLPLVGSPVTLPSRASPRGNYFLDSRRPSHGSRDREGATVFMEGCTRARYEITIANVGRAILPADALSSASCRLESRLQPGLAAPQMAQLFHASP